MDPAIDWGLGLGEEGDEAAEAAGAGVLALVLEAEREAEEDAALALHVRGHHGAPAARARPRRLPRPHHPRLLRAANHLHRHCRRRHLPPSFRTPGSIERNEAKSRGGRRWKFGFDGNPFGELLILGRRPVDGKGDYI